MQAGHTNRDLHSCYNCQTFFGALDIFGDVSYNALQYDGEVFALYVTITVGLVPTGITQGHFFAGHGLQHHRRCPVAQPDIFGEVGLQCPAMRGDFLHFM